MATGLQAGVYCIRHGDILSLTWMRTTYRRRQAGVYCIRHHLGKSIRVRYRMGDLILDGE